MREVGGHVTRTAEQKVCVLWQLKEEEGRRQVSKGRWRGGEERKGDEEVRRGDGCSLAHREGRGTRVQRLEACEKMQRVGRGVKREEGWKERDEG